MLLLKCFNNEQLIYELYGKVKLSFLPKRLPSLLSNFAVIFYTH